MSVPTPAVHASGVTDATDTAQAPAPAAGADLCAACGRALLGDFCHGCGERRLRADEMTLRAFVRDMASEVADLDSRAYRSLRLLFTRPGLLTAEWIAGRRRAYLGPLKLLVIAFAVLLLASSLLDRRPTTDMVRRLDGSWIGRAIEGLAGRLGLSRVETLERLNDAALSHLSWLSMLVPVVLAGVLAVVFVRRRRGYVEHLVFAAHTSAFYFILGLTIRVQQPAANPLPEVLQRAITVLVVGVTWAYLWRAITRVYGDRGWRAGLRSAVVVIGLNLAQMVATLLAFCTAALSLLYL
jgi:hypothetical protein